MNFPLLIRRGRLVLSVVGLACAVMVAAVVWRTAAVQRNNKNEDNHRFHASLRDGVGREVAFAKRGDDERACLASADSLSDFMFSRSGTGLSEATRSRLARLEASTLAGNSRRITSDELADVLATTAMERAATLSDFEIDSATETLRGFDAPDLPDSFRRGRNTIKLRASKASSLKPEEFVSQVKAVRDADSASRSLFHGAAKNAISTEIQKQLNSLSEAIPEQFGSASSGLTPIQAVLITYSVASDDLLTDSRVNLRKRLNSIQDGFTRITGRPYARAEGHFAYGKNGYVFSTPLDLLFDDRTSARLLDHIEERGANQ